MQLRRASARLRGAVEAFPPWAQPCRSAASGSKRPHSKLKCSTFLGRSPLISVGLEPVQIGRITSARGQTTSSKKGRSMREIWRKRAWVGLLNSLSGTANSRDL